MNRTSVFQLMFCCVALLCSCNPAQQLQRKQDAALNAVLASKPLLDKAGKQWAQLNPCVNDTSSLLLGGTDTLFHTDTVTVKSTDTITKTATITRNIITTKTVHDTLVKTIIDGRALRLLEKENQLINDSLNNYRLRYLSLKEREKEIGYSAGLLLKAFIRQWWFWVIIVIAVAGFILYKKLSIK